MRHSGKIGFLFVAAILLACIDYGACLKCYTCMTANPEFGSKCADPFPSVLQAEECSPTSLRKAGLQFRNVDDQLSGFLSNTLAPGPPNPEIPMLCQKIVMTRTNNETVVYRACQLDVPSMQIDACTRILSVQNDNIRKVEHCSSCRTDGCNGASSQNSSHGIAIAITVGSLIAKRATATAR